MSYYTHNASSALFHDRPAMIGASMAISEEDKMARELAIQQSRAVEMLIIMTLFILVSAVAFVLYVSFFWTAFKIVHGYPSIGVSPSAPGPFISQRYSAQWVFTYLLSLNFATTAMLALAIASPGGVSGAFLHSVFAFVSGIVNIVCLLALLLIYWWVCQNELACINAMGNSLSWCCVHSASSTLANQLCGAIYPICPGITQASLKIAPAMFWTFMAAIFGILSSFIHVILNEKLAMLFNLPVRGTDEDEDEKMD